MKLGNVSQTIVPVPNFFMDTTKDIDAFKIYYQNKRKKWKRSNSNLIKNSLFKSNLDINLNNNPRINNLKFIAINKEIYKPIYQKDITPNNCLIKETNYPEFTDLKLNQEISGKKTIFKKILNDIKCTNNENIFSIRNEIINNTYNLLERINSDYDINKYSNYDNPRTTFNKHFQINYSRLNDTIKKTHSERDLFMKTLRQKAYSLKTINFKTKESVKRSSIYKNFYIPDKENKKNQEDIKKNIKQLLDNKNINILKLDNNNKEIFKSNIKDKSFNDNNKFLTNRINRTKLYKDFPLKARAEFGKTKILIPQKLMKYLNDYSTKDK